MITKNPANTQNLAQKEVESFNFNDIYVKKDDICLSNKQISKIKSRSDELYRKRREYSKDLNLFTKNVKEEIYQREIENERIKQFNKVNTLLEVGQTELDNIRNNFPTLSFNFEEFKHNTFQHMKEEYDEQIKYSGGFPDIPIPKNHPKNILGYLYNNDKDGYKKYHKLQRSLIFAENNLNWAESYISLFRQTKQVTYLQTAVNLLKSANLRRIRRTAETGYTDTKTGYFSRNRFCSYSQQFKALQSEKQILKTLYYWEKKGYTASFLTLSPKNIKDLNKKDVLNFSKILKEFFRDPRVESVFQGYYGYLEIKEKKDLTFNLHVHLICLRSKTQKGVLKNTTEIFEDICNKFGNSKLQGSKIAKINRIQSLAKGKDVYRGAVKYIHQYITKGIDIDSLPARKIVVEATEGVRFLRSGGLLSLNNQKNIATEHEIYQTIAQFDELPAIPNEIPLGGQDFNSHITYKDYSFDKLCGLSSDDILQKIRKNKILFNNIKSSIFTVSKQYCPFLIEKVLEFNGTSKVSTRTNWKDPMFMHEALLSQELPSTFPYPEDIDSVIGRAEDVFLSVNATSPDYLKWL